MIEFANGLSVDVERGSIYDRNGNQSVPLALTRSGEMDFDDLVDLAQITFHADIEMADSLMRAVDNDPNVPAGNPSVGKLGQVTSEMEAYAPIREVMDRSVRTGYFVTTALESVFDPHHPRVAELVVLYANLNAAMGDLILLLDRNDASDIQSRLA